MFQEKLKEKDLIKLCNKYDIGFKDFISNEDGSFNLTCYSFKGIKATFKTTDFTCTLTTPTGKEKDFSLIWTFFILETLEQRKDKSLAEKYSQMLDEFNEQQETGTEI